MCAGRGGVERIRGMERDSRCYGRGRGIRQPDGPWPDVRRLQHARHQAAGGRRRRLRGDALAGVRRCHPATVQFRDQPHQSGRGPARNHDDGGHQRKTLGVSLGRGVGEPRPMAGKRDATARGPSRLFGRHPTTEAGRLDRNVCPRLRQIEALLDQRRLGLFAAANQAFVQTV